MTNRSASLTWLMSIGAALLALAAVLPLIEIDHWVLAALEFPRLHFAVLGILILAVGALRWRRLFRTGQVALLIVGATLLYQLWWIVPYTPLVGHHSRSAPKKTPRSELSLLVANVFMENRECAAFLNTVRSLSPDVVVTLETDQRWVSELGSLDANWPHSITVPLENTYGLSLHSRLTIVDSEVHYLVQDDIPSIRAKLKLTGGAEVELWAIHPRPPRPGGAGEPSRRNAELLIVADRVRAREKPTIVVGDLNAVAWSKVTRLFLDTARLLDPRVGRSFAGTWNTNWPGPKFPLDHAFHDESFALAHLDTHTIRGSDHRAMLVKLQLLSERAQAPAPDTKSSDEREALDIVERGRKAVEPSGSD